MKIFILPTLLLLAFGAIAQESEVKFDQSFADSLGADAYGMKSYIFVALKTGPVTITDKDSVNTIMRGHLNNISRLAKEGKIILAGPYGKNDLGFRGLFIFDETDVEVVKELLQTDPAIAAGVFDTDIIPWYGSAALPTYLPNHLRVQKVSP